METLKRPRAAILASTSGRRSPPETNEIAPRAGGRCSPETAARAQASSAEAVVDRELVRRFNDGDETAFVEIVARHRERIHALADRLLRNHADAEEIMQDTFIRAYRGLGRFRGDSSLATWLHRVAFNLARNRYWHYFRRRRHLTVSLDCPVGADTETTFSEFVPTTDPDPARQATVDEFVVLVVACMEKLDAGHRDILILRNQLHCSYEEIARSLGITEGTVKSRIARARGKLRGLIVDACPEFRLDAADSDWFEPNRSVARVA